MARGKYKRKRERKAQRQVSVGNLGLSSRTQNLLESSAIRTLADLLEKTDAELLAIKGIGPATLAEINRNKISAKSYFEKNTETNREENGCGDV